MQDDADPAKQPRIGVDGDEVAVRMREELPEDAAFRGMAAAPETTEAFLVAKREYAGGDW